MKNVLSALLNKNSTLCYTVLRSSRTNLIIPSHLLLLFYLSSSSSSLSLLCIMICFQMALQAWLACGWSCVHCERDGAVLTLYVRLGAVLTLYAEWEDSTLPLWGALSTELWEELLDFLQTLHRHYTNITQTLHRHYTDITQTLQTLHRHYTDITRTLHKHYTNITQTLHKHYTDITWTLHKHYTDIT